MSVLPHLGQRPAFIGLPVVRIVFELFVQDQTYLRVQKSLVEMNRGPSLQLCQYLRYWQRLVATQFPLY